MTEVLFVSINQSFRDTYSLSQVECCVERAWPISVAKAAKCDRVVAVVGGRPVGAWRVRAVFPTDETYRVNNGETRPRIGLSLGEPLPILGAYDEQAAFRRGVKVASLDEVPPLSDERVYRADVID